MSYKNGQNVRHTAARARHTRVKARFVKKFGTRGSANTFALTGKQAARLGRAYHRDLYSEKDADYSIEEISEQGETA